MTLRGGVLLALSCEVCVCGSEGGGGGRLGLGGCKSAKAPSVSATSPACKCLARCTQSTIADISLLFVSIFLFFRQCRQSQQLPTKSLLPPSTDSWRPQNPPLPQKVRTQINKTNPIITPTLNKPSYPYATQSQYISRAAQLGLLSGKQTRACKHVRIKGQILAAGPLDRG